MTETKRKKLTYASLVVAVVWGAYNFPFGDSQSSKQGNVSVVNSTPAVEQQISSSERISTAKIESASWGNDPFQAKTASITKTEWTDPDSPVWVLSGIVYNPHNPIAIINHKTVRLGDTIDNAEVKSIEAKHVVLDYKGESFRLTVTKG